MPVAKEQVLEQVQRVLESDLFRSSEIQRRLLKYLAGKSVAGEADDLKEYTIGTEGIGKPASYDPRRDSTVRLQISKLRQKIAEYYLTAGQNDAIILDLPKGHFKLVAALRGQPAEPPDGCAARWRTASAVLAAALALTIGLSIFLCASLSRVKTAAGALTPSLEEFWGPLAASGKPTLVCLGTPMFVRLGSSGNLFRNSDVNSWTAAQGSGLAERLERLFPGTKAEPWYVFTTLGEAGGAFMLGKTLAARMPDLQLANSTELSWEQIRADNVVFVGPNRFNQQIAALPARQDFAMENSGVRNLHPQAGEPALYEDVTGENHSGSAYALVSRLPGLHGDGHIVVLSGTGIPGTLAAAEFVTSETYAAEMLRRIRLASGRLPPCYQVVLRCKFNQWLPVEIEYVVHHVLAPA